MRTASVLCAGLGLGLAAITGGQMPLLAAPTAGAVRVTETAGGFSYVVPAGWQSGPFPGLKYKIAFSRPINGFAPNINVVDQAMQLPLAAYVRLNVTQMKQMLPGFHVIGQSAFTTSSGLQGARLAAQDNILGKKLHQTFYFFSGHGAHKLVVTASVPVSAGTKFDQAIDASMKTFTVK